VPRSNAGRRSSLLMARGHGARRTRSPGHREGGNIARYAAGLRKAGVKDVTTALVPNAGHFTPEEAPADVWKALVSRWCGPDGSAARPLARP
jgi:pimeloyl-ACP methyl ester carboxylesterase